MTSSSTAAVLTTLTALGSFALVARAQAPAVPPPDAPVVTAAPAAAPRKPPPAPPKTLPKANNPSAAASGKSQAPSASGAPAAPSASASAAPAQPGDAPKTYPTCSERIAEGKKPPKLEEKFPKRGLSGHVATLEVEVEHLKGEEILPGGFRITESDARSALEAAQFFLPDPKGEAAPSVKRREDGTHTTVTVPLVPLPKKPGRQVLELPPLPITLARANGAVITVCTQPHELTLEDPIANTPDPKPKPNPAPRRQLEEWVMLEQLVIGGLVALAVGLLAAWAFSRWRRRPRPQKPGPPPRPPWEVALEELHDIRHAGLIKAHRYSEHFDRVSDTIRKYLGDRYDFDGLESTTREALTLLGQRTPPPEPLDKIKAFLRQADLVKFANLTPTEEECELALSRGEDIVRLTRPVLPKPTSPLEPGSEEHAPQKAAPEGTEEDERTEGEAP